jgi:hypothetical protein
MKKVIPPPLPASAVTAKLVSPFIASRRLTGKPFGRITFQNVSLRTFGELSRVEVKKRYHKMNAAFRNENSCLLMFFAIVRSLQFKRIPMPA